ncbi:MAG: hypothetical protein ABS92_02960 [Thiobacillus sp. SCN 63-374]|nr:MAG: hypothetical protein ABS92_02960 [Thiobacillus sp. SCN 63-374]
MYALYISIYVFIAISAAIALVLGVFTASRGVERFGSKGVMMVYLWLMMLAPALRIMTAPREYLTDADATLAGYTAISGPVTWALRLSTVAIVSVAGVVMLMALIRRQKLSGGTFLAVGLGAVFTTMLTSAGLGAKPAFIHQSLYTVLMLATLLVMPRIAPEQVAIQAKRVLAFLVIGSLVLAVIQPAHYVESGYVGIIPGFHYRLHGLAPHANSLAPLALLYLILAYWVRGKNPWHILGVVSAAAVLVLSQSKTIWLSALLIVFVIVVTRVSRQFGQELRSARIGWGTITTLSAYLGAGLMLLWMFSGEAGRVFHALMADSDVSTLTGRTDIWRVTLDTWRKSPWFGYGPKLWDLEFRITHGTLAAWHAHNQFLQALGEAGIVGLVSMLIYMAALIYYAVRFAGPTRGVTLALLLLILSRTMTEVPIRFSGVLDVGFFIQIVVFAVLVMLARQATAESKMIAAAPVKRAQLPQQA